MILPYNHSNLVFTITSDLNGIEIVFLDKPNEGERIYFDGIMDIHGVKIPRIRHWYEVKDDSYSGSDIISKEVTE